MTVPRHLTVLQVCANRWWTGSADPVIRLVKGIEARGHRALLALILGDRFEAKAREAGIEPVAGLSLEVKFHPAAVVRDVIRLRRLVRNEGVDIIHVHHSHDHWLGMLSRGPAALVRTFHNQRAVRAAWPAPWLHRHTDGVIAVSRQIEERCRLLGIAAARVFRVNGVVDITRFAAGSNGEPIRAELGVGPGQLIGSVARLAPHRGHELLIAAFERLLPDYPGLRLLLIGKGEARPTLEARVRERGLGEHVLFAGYRDADLPEVLQALDAFVLMGPGSDESCRAALEAMAAARPVVARRLGALPDAIVHGSTGFLVDGEEPGAVEAALRALLADPGLAKAMGQAGRRRAEECFSPERHAADVEAIYLSVLARRESAR